ncbi:hypothetical protein GCM10011317_47800 [Niveispirillum cyanobacteriorum]|nr:hypothetical protein GCM10011317_47800 [Niveispirillum cyanobacteriorum]
MAAMATGLSSACPCNVASEITSSDTPAAIIQASLDRVIDMGTTPCQKGAERGFPPPPIDGGSCKRGLF